MANFVKLDENNIVLEVNVVSNDVLDASNEEASGIAFLTEWSGGYSNWKQTSYNAAINGFRKNYAGIGYHWDGTGFYPPQPYPSWSLNQDTYLWEAPTAMPEDGKVYTWDEPTTSWVEVTL